MVLAGFVTACRLASRPTRRSPVLVKATTDGTVRPPSAEGMTVGSPPSMTATTELVVPRSMPMILPIGVAAPVLLSGSVDASIDFGRFVRFVGCSGVLGDGHEGRPDHAAAESVAPAQLVDDLAARASGPRHVGHGLVLAGVELHARGGLDGAHALALEEQAELAIDRSDALDPGLVDAGLRL